jgi:hypothetical protein
MGDTRTSDTSTVHSIAIKGVTMPRTVIVAAIATLCSITANAQSTPPSMPATEDFASAKTHQLARLEKELACVQAATSLDELRACRPAPPHGGMGGPPPS